MKFQNFYTGATIRRFSAIILILGLAIPYYRCSNNNQKHAQKGVLTVKGFYVGMPADELIKLLKDEHRELISIDRENHYLDFTIKVDTVCGEEYTYAASRDIPYSISDPLPSIVKTKLESNSFPTPDTVIYELYVSREQMEIESKWEPCLIRTYFARCSWDLPIYLNNRHALSAGSNTFEFNSEDRLVKMHFTKYQVDKLFNAHDMSVMDFAQAFAENYKIPTMSPMSDNSGTEYLECTDPKGYKITITEDKELAILAVPKPSERKFD